MLIAITSTIAAYAEWKVNGIHYYTVAVTTIQLADPLVFWAALTLLPLFGFPVAPLLISAGVRFPVPAAFGIAASSILANLFLSHAIGNHVLRALLTRILLRLGHQIPSIPAGQHRRAVFLVRITPGVPVSIANYLLVLGGVRLVDFMLISFPIQLVFAAGFLLLGGSIVGGNLTWALLAIVLILAIKFFFQSRISKVRKYSGSRPGYTLKDNPSDQ